MKNSIALFILICLAYNRVNAQVKNPNYQYFPDANQKQEVNQSDYKKIFLGFALGINNPSGVIGPNFEYFAFNGFSGTAGFGISTWGYKATLTGKYYLKKYPLKSAFALGISHCTGGETTSRVTYGNNNDVTTVNVRLLPAQAVNLSWLRYWRMGKYSRVHLELGYSVSVQGKSGSSVLLASQETDPLVIRAFNEQNRRTIALLQPGGLILATGFTFGL